MTIKIVQAVDYGGRHAYAPGSVSAIINLANLNSAVLIPRENTRSAFDDITCLIFNDGSHLDVFGKPEDFEL